VITEGFFRRDIQQLRAFAITLVVLHHFDVPIFRGGFIGVDIFFVISGFLITQNLQSLVRKNEKIGKFWSLIVIKKFFIKRFFRIFPASFAVLIFVLIASFFSLSPILARQNLNDSLWAFFGSFNWHAIRMKENYFDVSLETSPFLHYWSLGVEEQFYVIYPFVFIAFAVIGSSLRKSGPLRILRLKALLVVCTAVSFYLFVVSAFIDPINQYFSTFTRFWELAAGAFLALLRFSWNQDMASSSLRYVRFLIYCSLFLINLFYDDISGWNFLSVFGAVVLTSILISLPVSETLKISPVKFFSDVTLFIGKISYSVYLVHWPLFIFIQMSPLESLPLVLLNSAQVILLIVISTFSYRLIEKPLTDFGRNLAENVHGHFPTYQKSKLPFLQLMRNRRSMLFRKADHYLEVFLIFTFIFVLVLFVFQNQSKQQEFSNFTPPKIGVESLSEDFLPMILDEDQVPIDQPSPGKRELGELTGSSADSGDSFAVQLSAWENKIAANVGLTSIPAELRKSVTRDAGSNLWQRESCGMALQGSSCTFGRGSKLVIFVGDSYAIMHQAMVRNAFNPEKFTVEGRFFPYCKFANVTPLAIDKRPAKECLKWYESTLKYISIKKPHLLIISEMDTTKILMGQTPLNSEESLSEISKGLEKSINLVKKNVGTVLVLGQTVQSNSISSCTNSKFDFVKSCHASPSSNLDVSNMQMEVAKSTKSKYFSFNQLLCTATECPPIIDKTLVFVDGNHLTDSFSRKLAPMFAAYIKELGI
jgi:peptidoglycan/LPS O-acetylase OafA/YrhL